MSHTNSTLQEKLAQLQSQLRAVDDGTDPEYLSRVREVERIRDNRLFVAEAFRDYELSVANEDYERERDASLQQYEAKKLELKEYLLHDLQDKKRAYDNYRNTVELSAPGKYAMSGGGARQIDRANLTTCIQRVCLSLTQTPTNSYTPLSTCV